MFTITTKLQRKRHLKNAAFLHACWTFPGLPSGLRNESFNITNLLGRTLQKPLIDIKFNDETHRKRFNLGILDALLLLVLWGELLATGYALIRVTQSLLSMVAPATFIGHHKIFGAVLFFSWHAWLTCMAMWFIDDQVQAFVPHQNFKTEGLYQQASLVILFQP